MTPSPDTILIHVHADAHLSPKTASALARLIALAVEAMERDEIIEDDDCPDCQSLMDACTCWPDEQPDGMKGG